MPFVVKLIVLALFLSINVSVSVAKPKTLSSGILICSDDVHESVESTQFHVLSPSPLLTVIPAPSAAASFAAPLAISMFLSSTVMVAVLIVVVVPSTWRLPVTLRLFETVVVASVTVTLAVPPVSILTSSEPENLICVSESPSCIILSGMIRSLEILVSVFVTVTLADPPVSNFISFSKNVMSVSVSSL